MAGAGKRRHQDARKGGSTSAPSRPDVSETEQPIASYDGPSDAPNSNPFGPGLGYDPAKPVRSSESAVPRNLEVPASAYVRTHFSFSFSFLSEPRPLVRLYRYSSSDSSLLLLLLLSYNLNLLSATTFLQNQLIISSTLGLSRHTCITAATIKHTATLFIILQQATSDCSWCNQHLALLIYLPKTLLFLCALHLRSLLHDLYYTSHFHSSNLSRYNGAAELSAL